MEQPESFTKGMTQDGKKTIYYGGGGFFFRYDKMKEAITAKGFVDTEAKAAYWDKFFHTRQSAGANPDYFVYKLDTSKYLPFYDYNGTDKVGVGRGWFRDCKVSYIADDNNKYPIQIKFDVVWS